MRPESRSVLLVDDQDLVRTGLRLILESAPTIAVAGEASDGDAALLALRESPADIVLMDVQMNGMGGIEATRLIKAEFPQTAVVLLSAFDDDEMVNDGLRAGADGFLLKATESEALLSCLGQVGRGRVVVDPRIARRLVDRLLNEVPAQGSPPGELTPRESEIFQLVATGLPNAEIAEVLSLSPVTVRSHVDNILGKLGLSHRPEIIVYAYQHGIISVPMRAQRITEPADPPTE